MSRSDREGGLQRAADELREKLGRFASRPRFNLEFEAAFDFYFGDGSGGLQPALGEADFERFMEWFVHDYPMSDGRRLIELFDLEHRAELSIHGRRLLRQWLRAHLTLFEVLDGGRNGWRLADLLTGRLLEGARIPGEPPARWSLIVGRPLRVGRGYELSGARAPLPPAIKETLLDHLRGEFRRYRRRHEGATVELFLRANGHLFNDLLVELEDQIAVAELYEEGAYRLVHSQAIFDVRDVDRVTSRLLAYDDFKQIRPGKMIWHDGGTHAGATKQAANGAPVRLSDRATERALSASTGKHSGASPNGFPGATSVASSPSAPPSTVSRSGSSGHSASDSASESASQSMIESSSDSPSESMGKPRGRSTGNSLSALPGGVGRTLAEISFANGRMQVHCWSRERLEACKSLLAQRLKGLVRHLVDAYQDSLPTLGDTVPVGTLRTTSTNGKVRNDAQLVAGPGADAAAGACEEFIESWLSKPQAALRFATPASLASSTLGRVRVAELLKQMEYRQRSRFGERGGIAPRELRRRLGLDEESVYLFPLGSFPAIWNRDTEVAVIEELAWIGGEVLTQEHLDSAAWMWWTYCSLVNQVIRKPAAWAAALHSCIAFVEDWQITQEEIAVRYGVSPSTVSQNSWKLIDRLSLEVFDHRFSLVQSSSGVFRRFGVSPVAPGPLESDKLSESLSAANHLRDRVARALDGHVSLRQRAYAFYVSHAGSRKAAAWEEAFLDWYHFDWRVPVMGGRTLVETVLLSGSLSPQEKEMLEGWVGCHPSFYVVKGVEHGSGASGGSDGSNGSGGSGGSPGSSRSGGGRPRPPIKLTLVDLMDASVTAVDWLKLANPVGPGDVLFARLVPVAGAMISLGPVLDYPPRYHEIFQQALLEDRALVERWNGRALPWEEFRARYSERLYALALQGMADGGADRFEE